MQNSGNHRVAVIGAGISGVCTAAHLLKYGLSVTVLERCDVAGGVWHFDERSAKDPCYPNNQPSKGDYVKYVTGESAYATPPRTPDGDSGRSNTQSVKHISQYGQDFRISHAPPSPCYSSLKNNVPLTLMKTSLLDWPLGLEEFVSQKHLEEYIQQLSKVCGVDRVTEYNTRVENVIKRGNIWQVSTAALHFDSEMPKISLRIREFDAVIVASGHYHMPRVPDIPGLKEWKEKLPDRVRHSKTYRSAEGFENQKVLLIGSGVSSCDIAKDLAAKQTETYQSSRGGVLELPSSFLPASALRMGPVTSFTLDNAPEAQYALSRNEHIPGHITLQNGSKLCGIHQVILATGYITSYPFLPDYHSDTQSKLFAGDRLLVTSEGDMVHNLHKDIFYIEDSTLAFVGVPYHIATFSLYDFQAQIVARFLGGYLKLPSQSDMRSEYQTRVRLKGLGRDFHSLRDTGEETRYVKDLVDWANCDALSLNGQLMDGHSETWLKAYVEQKERIKFLVGSRRNDADATRYDLVTIPETVTCM